MTGTAVRTLADAFDFACRCHRDQRRKGAGGHPYVDHVAEVAALAAEASDGRDTGLIVAALLHDAVEDGHTTAGEIAGRFGDDVAGLVMELTDDMSLPQADRRRLQVEKAPGMSPRARLLKLCDKVSNLREIAREPPRDWSIEDRRAYFDWGKQVVDALRGTDAGLEAAFDEIYAERP